MREKQFSYSHRLKSKSKILNSHSSKLKIKHSEIQMLWKPKKSVLYIWHNCNFWLSNQGKIEDALNKCTSIWCTYVSWKFSKDNLKIKHPIDIAKKKKTFKHMLTCEPFNFMDHSKKLIISRLLETYDLTEFTNDEMCEYHAFKQIRSRFCLTTGSHNMSIPISWV